MSAATSTDTHSYVVDVRDDIDARLAATPAGPTSPPQSAADATRLTQLPTGLQVSRADPCGTWTTAIVGGRRVVTIARHA